MAHSPKALIDPAVLQWLRKTSGYSIEEAAKRIPTSPDNLQAWEENNAEKPSMSQLRRLARIFKRPISDFFLPRPMQEPEIPHDFRRLPDDGLHAYSPALRHEIRLAYRRRTLAIDLAQELEVTVPVFAAKGTAAVTEDAEAVGTRVRELLRVTDHEQVQWRDPRAGYNVWRQKIEALGVLVFQVTTVEKAQMLGFSLIFDRLPVVAINRKLKPNGRTFTMLHEFAHLLLGEGGICDIDEDVLRRPHEQAMEVFCNHVAGAALVPMAALLGHRLVAGVRAPQDWADEILDTLARDFSVSHEVVLRRLLIGRRTTQDFYARKRHEYLARVARLEQIEKDQAAENFGRNMAQEAVSNLGAFARLVVNSYQSDTINLTDASKFLGIKAEKVAAVGELLR
jgi:Zn-dependent peptidase ImmA (M78 family)/transcriptional regulator with XRE-family HTH domain